MKRKLIQIVATLITNSQLTNFLSGKLYKGSLKNFCSPGLNCYSCPAANFSCPLGAMQTIIASARFSLSYYVTGFLILIGLLIGRGVCGFLCPFGLLQEIFYKLPLPKINLWRPLIYLKYFLLVIFVLILPEILKLGDPAFCEYICPAGTFEAAIPMLITHQEFRSAIGDLFKLKMIILIATLIGCMINYRFFCKVLCPLGAVYGLTNKFSIYRLHVDENLCINCGRCKKICKMEIDPSKNPNSIECIRCGDCEKICPKKAIRI